MPLRLLFIGSLALFLTAAGDNVLLADPPGGPFVGVQAEAPSPEIEKLAKTILIPELLELLHAEGLNRSEDMEKEMFPDRGGARWTAAVEAIYDVPAMRQRFMKVLSRELSDDPAAVAEAETFFASDLGQKALKLEIDARYALLDVAVEEAARVTADDLAAAKDPRMKLVRRFADVNELIEMNVAGAMTGNLAFFEGLATEGMLGQDMTEEKIISDVWGQEEQIRADTKTWLYPFLVMAYQPLEDADLEAYIAFSETPSGKKLNAALFAAFDEVFKKISFDLGKAAGRAMHGSNI
jgi:hypothetical protein